MGVASEISFDDVVLKNNLKQMQFINVSQLDLNSKVNVIYFHRNLSYSVDVKYAELPSKGTAAEINANINAKDKD